MSIDTVRRIVGPTIKTASGDYFDLEDPDFRSIKIEDINCACAIHDLPHPSEVRILTGRAHKEPQKAVLRANGIPYFVNAAGWAIVARTAVVPAPATPKWSPVRGQAQHTS